MQGDAPTTEQPKAPAAEKPQQNTTSNISGQDRTDCAPSKQTQNVQKEESRSRSNTPTIEKKPTVKTPLQVISDIHTECRQYEERVNAFNGPKKAKEYKLLEEMLTRSLLKLDSVESGHDDTIRQARKAAVREIQSYFDQLELKAFSWVMSDSSQSTPDSKSDGANSGPERMDESSQSESKVKDERDVKEMVLGSEVTC